MLHQLLPLLLRCMGNVRVRLLWCVGQVVAMRDLQADGSSSRRAAMSILNFNSNTVRYSISPFPTGKHPSVKQASVSQTVAGKVNHLLLVPNIRHTQPQQRIPNHQQCCKLLKFLHSTKAVFNPQPPPLPAQSLSRDFLLAAGYLFVRLTRLKSLMTKSLFHQRAERT